MPIPQTTLCYAPLCLAILQPTIRSALLRLASLKLTICSAIPVLPVDITTYNRLSALLCLLSSDTAADYLRCSTLSGDDTSEYPIYRLSALIYMAILQTTLYCDLLCLAILQATICGTLLCLATIQAPI
jgi:hypothetical protein